MLRYALWCQMQRTPRGKLLKILSRLLSHCTHNAEVEGSSPSLTTIKSLAASREPPRWIHDLLFTKPGIHLEQRHFGEVAGELGEQETLW